MSFHGRVVALRADEREHVALAPVLAHQGRGEPEPASGLHAGRHAEDGRGQQVHLVVDDESPVAGVEQLEVGVDALPAGGHHLVRGDGDRPDLLAGTGVFADLVLGQRRAVEQLMAPLPGGDRVGHQDQGRRLRLGHRRRADDGLAGAAGQHHDSGPAVPEAFDGLLLVGPHGPAVLHQRDRVCLAVDVAGEVLGRPAQLEQHLLEVAALGRVHDDRVSVDALPDQRRDLLRPHDLFEHRAVAGGEHQPVDGVLLEPQPAVAGHRLGDVDEQRVGHGVAAVFQQYVDDLLGIVARGPRVPQAQRGQPVGVHVLGRALQLGERRDQAPALAGQLVVDLEQQRLVGLDDQWAVGHAGPFASNVVEPAAQFALDPVSTMPDPEPFPAR